MRIFRRGTLTLAIPQVWIVHEAQIQFSLGSTQRKFLLAACAASLDLAFG